jgi:hypothetical protein
MQKNRLFITLPVMFCLEIGCLWAVPADKKDDPKGVLLLPEGISVELVSPEHGALMLTGKEGRVELPQGRYRLESWTLEKKDEKGQVWNLSGDLRMARMITVGSEPVQLDIKSEPIVCDLKAYPGSNSMNLTLGLDGPGGERLRVWGNVPGIKQDQLPQPAFEIYNADRSFSKTYDFQSQCCGNYRLNWMFPAGIKGPFWINIKVAGPFKLDFKPFNLSELSEKTRAQQQKARAEAIARQQLNLKKLIRLTAWISGAYLCAISAVVFLLIKFRKRIEAADWGQTRLPTKWLVMVLGIAVVLLMLDPLVQLGMGDSEYKDVLFQNSSIAAVILVGALLVWAVRKTPTRWPFATILLYELLFVLFLIPVLFVIFMTVGQPDGNFFDIPLRYWAEFYSTLFTFPYTEVRIIWLIIAAMLGVQASLLIIPVRVTHQRPRPQRGIWWTATMAGLLYTTLLFFAALSIIAVVWNEDVPEALIWFIVAILPINWVAWAMVFGLFGRSMEPRDYIQRLTQWLIRGSIFELLIAVTSHIIVRHQNVFGACFLTAGSITVGLSVMFFVVGIRLYFRYADRLRSYKCSLST